MRRNLVLAVCILLNVFAKAQVTWSEDIAPIVFNNCVTCHREDGIAPFSLMTYAEAFVKSGEIEEAVLTGEMPPWPADPNYRHFADELVLTADEKFKISQWIADGAEEGNPDLAPDAPVFNFGTSVLDTVHKSFSIGSYTTQYDVDEYRHFVIETGFTETQYFNVMEIIPGNWNLVHHVDVYLDPTNTSFELDQLDTLAGFNDATGWPNLNTYVGGWSPGSGPLFLPPNWGIEIPVGSDIILQIHYAPDNLGLNDTTRINFNMVENVDDIRKVEVSTPLYNPAGGAPLIIPENEIIDFTQKSFAMANDKSFIAIMPHMHKLGKSYKIWYKTIEGDSIPIIDIPIWDFHWQYFYTFPSIVKVPEGARFHATAWYDNTSDNPDNPNDPPITVYEGSYTSDEMLMTFMAFTDYEEGDEFIIIDSAYYEPVNIFDLESDQTFNIYPNPATENITIESAGLSGLIDIKIIDLLGKEILYWKNINDIQADEFKQTFQVDDFSTGVYIVQLNTNEGSYTRKLIIF